MPRDITTFDTGFRQVPAEFVEEYDTPTGCHVRHVVSFTRRGTTLVRDDHYEISTAESFRADPARARRARSAQ